MTRPNVSRYDDAFIEAFGRGVEELPDAQTKLVKDIVDRIQEEVVTQIEAYVRDDMARNCSDALRETAAQMTESMLSNALAGDNYTIRNLFGFNDWYLKSLYIGPRPTQWALIDAIVARCPDVFLDERLAQRDAEIARMAQDKANLMRRIQYLENPHAGDGG